MDKFKNIIIAISTVLFFSGCSNFLADVNLEGNDFDIINIDTVAPSAPVVTVAENAYDYGNNNSFAFGLSGENSALYEYTIVSSNGGDTIENSGSLDNNGSATINNLDLTFFTDGEITVTVYLSDSAGNKSKSGIDTAILQTSWELDQDSIADDVQLINKSENGESFLETVSEAIGGFLFIDNEIGIMNRNTGNGLEITWKIKFPEETYDYTQWHDNLKFAIRLTPSGTDGSMDYEFLHIPHRTNKPGKDELQLVFNDGSTWVGTDAGLLQPHGPDGNSGSTANSDNGWMGFKAELLPLSEDNNMRFSMDMDGDGVYEVTLFAADDSYDSFDKLRLHIWKSTSPGYILQMKDLKIQER